MGKPDIADGECGHPRPSGGAPLVVDPELIELGVVPAGKRVEVRARVTNRSAQVVTLGRPTAVALEGC
jgi:hypothetical protein